MSPLGGPARNLASILVGVALTVGLVGCGDPVGETGSPPASTSTSVAEPDTSPPEAIQQTSTTTTPTTTVAPPTTEPEAKATTTTLSSGANGYTAVAEPAPRPNTVAPGGALTKHLADDIATAFGFHPAQVEAAIDSLELPPEASGHPEGWLAPGTYEVPDDATVGDVVQAMVNRRLAQLTERDIPRADWRRVLTAASVIEKETYNQSEKPRVARVLTNRLAGGGPLQMDSIILYPVPEDRIFTTADERASDDPYNSYRYDGLPPTPISAPDEASIDAFLDPPPGAWWFYVTIDLHSGETRYAVTYEEHLENVELLRSWLRENPTP